MVPNDVEALGSAQHLRLGAHQKCAYWDECTQNVLGGYAIFKGEKENILICFQCFHLQFYTSIAVPDNMADCATTLL